MASSRVSGVRLDALWKNTREAVFVLNGERRLTYVNRAWEELTGYDAGAVLGLACHGQVSPDAGDTSGLAASFCPPPEAMDGRPAGGLTLIVHAAGEADGVWHIVEVWDSEAYADAFDRDVLVPAIEAATGRPPPGDAPVVSFDLHQLVTP